MKTIHRLEFPVDDATQTRLSGFLQGVHVAPSRRDPTSFCELWYEADPDRGPVDVTIYVEGTGHPIDHAGLYVGSYIQPSRDPRSSLVWHVYVERRIAMVTA